MAHVSDPPCSAFRGTSLEFVQRCHEGYHTGSCDGKRAQDSHVDPTLGAISVRVKAAILPSERSQRPAARYTGSLPASKEPDGEAVVHIVALCCAPIRLRLCRVVPRLPVREWTRDCIRRVRSWRAIGLISHCRVPSRRSGKSAHGWAATTVPRGHVDLMPGKRQCLAGRVFRLAAKEM